MKPIIVETQKWICYYGSSGMTATEWVGQVLGFERKVETDPIEVMRVLNIGGWSHAYHYNGDFGIGNTKHAFETLTEEVKKLAEDLDKRLQDLTAVESRYKELIAEQDEEPLSHE